jgi:hypothetical protein
MKALRIKTFDHDLNLSRFEIVLLKDIAFQKVSFLLSNNEACLDLELHNGKLFLLKLACDESQFEKFKWRWDRFKENEDYYFDLSDWEL